MNTIFLLHNKNQYHIDAEQSILGVFRDAFAYSSHIEYHTALLDQQEDID